MKHIEKLNVSEIVMDAGYISKHIFLVVAPHGSEKDELPKKKYLNLDVIMKLRIQPDDGVAVLSTRVTYPLLDAVEISEEDAWHYATRNSEMTSSSMPICEALGLPVNDDFPLNVAMANNGIDGASVIVFPELFREYCLKHNESSALILPSSTQEVIFMPDGGGYDLSLLVALVKDINSSMVDESQQLEPSVYRYTLSDNTISLVGTLQEVL